MSTEVQFNLYDFSEETLEFLYDLPTEFPPSPHTHTPADIPDLPDLVNGTGTISVGAIEAIGLDVQEDATISGVLTADDIQGNLTGNVYVSVRAGEDLLKGDIVYVSGTYTSGATSLPIVSRADSSNSAKMPAIGIMDSDLGTGYNGSMVISGRVSNFNTNAYNLNAELYVASGGGFTATAPTSRAQVVARVERKNSNFGSVIVSIDSISSGNTNSITSATTSDGTANLSISNVTTATATVSSLLTANHIHGNIAGTLYTHVRTGEAVVKGDPVYVSGFHNGTSQPIVSKADASNPAKMPAIGVMDDAYAQNVSGANCVIAGTITSVDTDDFSVNSPVYVGNGGGFSKTIGTIPQQVGIVERSNQNTGAFVVTNNKVISSADITDATSDGDANKEKVLKTDSQGSLTVTNAFGVNASFGSSLVVGDGDSVNGRYDIFNNSSHLQWYSDSAPYGEREFVITTQNLTSSGSWGYKYPAASGTFAVTASTTGVPDKLTDGTIAGTTTFNSTSYTYGTGAAAAHRTALGLTTLATTTPAINVATFLETPSSVNLAAAVTGETGTGSLVFGTSPSLTTPSIAGLTLSGLVTHSGSYSQTGGTNFNVAVTTAANLTATGSGTVTVGGAGGTTISGSAAFTSTTRPTSAATGTPAATSLMTRDDVALEPFYNLGSIFRVSAIPAFLTSGTGSAATTNAGDRWVALSSGTSNSGWGRAQIGRGITTVPSLSGAGINFASKLGVSIVLWLGNSAATNNLNIFRLRFGSDNTPVADGVDAVSYRGFGVEIKARGTSHDWRVYGHNGTSITYSAWSNTGMNVDTLQTRINLSVISDGSGTITASLGVNGSRTLSTITTTGGPTTAGTSAQAFVECHVANSASGTSPLAAALYDAIFYAKS